MKCLPEVGEQSDPVAALRRYLWHFLDANQSSIGKV